VSTTDAPPCSSFCNGWTSIWPAARALSPARRLW
jgi:hypothetical protein